MYEYIIVDIADVYYEEGGYLKKCKTYDEAKQYLIDNQMLTLIEKLDYLEAIKHTLIDNEIIISYY